MSPFELIKSTEYQPRILRTLSTCARRDLIWFSAAFFIFHMLVLPPAQAIVNGIRADHPTLPPFIRATADSVIQLFVNSSSRPCTGVHIGDGYVLTARHCIEGARNVAFYANPIGLPTIELSSLILPNQYNTYPFRKASTPSNLHGIPDLILIEAVDPHLVEQYQELPRVELPDRPYSLDEFETFYSFGYGQGSSRDMSHVAQLPVEKAEETLKHYSASEGVKAASEYLWGSRNKKDSAYVAPGDSGGPLIGVTKDHRAILIGITFSTPGELQLNDRDALNNSAGSDAILNQNLHIGLFTRLDHPFVLETLLPIKQALDKKLNASQTCSKSFND